MRLSRLFFSTLREPPADAEVLSHQLMLRAGLIRKLASGIYQWMPLGLRVLRSVERIVREEMETAGAQEILMPMVQPAELWQDSGRWDQYGAELLRFSDRHQHAFCLGPTHEEVICHLFKNNVQSYKQLPRNLFQIQTKFRDEIRPRFGIMRAREFLMKDAYSFHASTQCLQKTYDTMYVAYSRIFERLGLSFRAVLADTGSIGGHSSHEFHVLAEAGEDRIAHSDGSDYAANVELAEAVALPDSGTGAIPEQATLHETPGCRTVEEACAAMGCPPSRMLKTLLVRGKEHPVIALILRGDHKLSEVKASKHPWIASPLTMATAEDTDLPFGSIGPVGLELPLVVDRSAASLQHFCCGANQEGQHYRGVVWSRDVGDGYAVTDLREVQSGDPSPDGLGTLHIHRGIEVGHIFQLGKKYSEAMDVSLLGSDGERFHPWMGCYGIGVSRIVAAAIEQHHDARGIVWPEAMAPFQIALVGIGIHDPLVEEKVTHYYRLLMAHGFDVLLDDRDERPGVRFADLDLIGIPHRLVLSPKTLEAGVIEYKARSSDASENIRLDNEVEFLLSLQRRLG